MYKICEYLYLFFASIAIGLIAIKDVGARHINMLDKLSLNMPKRGTSFLNQVAEVITYLKKCL